MKMKIINKKEETMNIRREIIRTEIISLTPSNIRKIKDFANRKSVSVEKALEILVQMGEIDFTQDKIWQYSETTKVNIW